MRKFFLAICLSIALSSASFATGEKSTPPPVPPTKPAANSAPADGKKEAWEQSPITVKNKSSFQLDAAARDPFWPINFKPKARIGGGSGDAEGDVPASAFLVSSITLGPALHFAIINGKTMIEGQQFGLQVGTQIFQVTVKRIEDGQVILGRHDEEIAVPLRRK